jgi:hypothetical protein
MNFRIRYPGFLFLVVSINCLSQTDSLISRNKISSDIKVSYNSSLIYPGIRAGIEFPVNTVSLTRSTKKGDSKSILKNRYLSAGSGWYHHPGFHDNLYFTVEWTMRRTVKNGFFTEFSSGAGYSRTFLGATTYRVDGNGKVNILKSAGYNYAMVIAGGGFGYNFAQSKKIPLSVFYKFDILTMFPYNSIVYFRPAMELGLIYKPLKFIQVLTKTRIVNK